MEMNNKCFHILFYVFMGFKGWRSREDTYPIVFSVPNSENWHYNLLNGLSRQQNIFMSTILNVIVKDKS